MSRDIKAAEGVVRLCRTISVERYQAFLGLDSVDEAASVKAEFLEYLSTLCRQFIALRRLGHDVEFYTTPFEAWEDWFSGVRYVEVVKPRRFSWSAMIRRALCLSPIA